MSRVGKPVSRSASRSSVQPTSIPCNRLNNGATPRISLRVHGISMETGTVPHYGSWTRLRLAGDDDGTELTAANGN
eukprot:scaffold612316_cov55-Prasinocladus_malaysianus.AAC.1